MSGVDLAALAPALANGTLRVIDLTQTLSPDFPTIVMPPELGASAPFRMEEISRYDARGPAWYWNNVSFGEHTGTHFDAPVHWVTGKNLPAGSVDTLPPQDFVAPACVVDCSRNVQADDDFIVTRACIESWEARHGRIPPRHWLLLRTDWSKRSGAAYANLRDDGAHTPGPDPECCRFLVEERDAFGLGVETIGTDWGQGAHFMPPYPAHHYFHGAGRYGLQCLTNLDLLPPKGAVIVAAPLKIRRGSGSPLRVFALVSS